MRKSNFLSLLLLSFLIIVFTTGCNNQDGNAKSVSSTDTEHTPQNIATTAKQDTTALERTVANAATIMSRVEVPVLCYHHIRTPGPQFSKSAQVYFVSPLDFAEQMKALSDSGFHTILPEQLYDYLVYGDSLPTNPVMLTFDDTDEEQYSVAWQEMKKYNFKGTFFIMTVSIGKKNYMSKEQIKDLSDNGNAVESHTWDHKNVKKYDSSDFKIQLLNPKKTIEEITGRTANYFAYPFGVWNENAIELLKKADFKLAFILSTKRDPKNPLYTVRRMIVPYGLSAKATISSLKKTFGREN